MCMQSDNHAACGCGCTCGYQGFIAVDDEIKLLEAAKVRIQVRLDQIERRIGSLKSRI